MTHQIKTLPNFFTGLRILLIAPIIISGLFGRFDLAFVLFVIGAATDGIDGQLARRLNQETTFGAILDPIADKLYVLCLIPFLWQTNDTLPLWFSVLICVRYLAQLSVIPVLTLWLKIPFNVEPKFIPKAATTFAFILIGSGLLLNSLNPDETAYGLLILSMQVLTAMLAVMEAYVLITFCPRYYQIIKGSHDTFE